MTPESKAFLIKAMERAKGDDLDRCVMAFRYFTEAEMGEIMWGQTTRQQYLDRLRAGNEQWDRAMTELEKLMAAAPQLLEALKAARRDITELDSQDERQFSIDRIDAAIAAYEGSKR